MIISSFIDQESLYPLNDDYYLINVEIWGLCINIIVHQLKSMNNFY